MYIIMYIVQLLSIQLVIVIVYIYIASHVRSICSFHLHGQLPIYAQSCVLSYVGAKHVYVLAT